MLSTWGWHEGNKTHGTRPHTRLEPSSATKEVSFISNRRNLAKKIFLWIQIWLSPLHAISIFFLFLIEIGTLSESNTYNLIRSVNSTLDLYCRSTSNASAKLLITHCKSSDETSCKNLTAEKMPGAEVVVKFPSLKFSDSGSYICKDTMSNSWEYISLSVKGTFENTKFGEKCIVWKIKIIAKSSFLLLLCHFFMIRELISNYIVLQSNPKHLKLWTAFLRISRNWLVPGTDRVYTLPRLNGRYGTVGDHYTV